MYGLWSHSTEVTFQLVTNRLRLLDSQVLVLVEFVVLLRTGSSPPSRSPLKWGIARSIDMT